LALQIARFAGCAQNKYSYNSTANESEFCTVVKLPLMNNVAGQKQIMQIMIETG
jgi:hypothetical protein